MMPFGDSPTTFSVINFITLFYSRRIAGRRGRRSNFRILPTGFPDQMHRSAQSADQQSGPGIRRFQAGAQRPLSVSATSVHPQRSVPHALISPIGAPITFCHLCCAITLIGLTVRPLRSACCRTLFNDVLDDSDARLTSGAFFDDVLRVVERIQFHDATNLMTPFYFFPSVSSSTLFLYGSLDLQSFNNLLNSVFRMPNIFGVAPCDVRNRWNAA